MLFPSNIAIHSVIIKPGTDEQQAGHTRFKKYEAGRLSIYRVIQEKWSAF